MYVYYCIHTVTIITVVLSLLISPQFIILNVIHSCVDIMSRNPPVVSLLIMMIIQIITMMIIIMMITIIVRVMIIIIMIIIIILITIKMIVIAIKIEMIVIIITMTMMIIKNMKTVVKRETPLHLLYLWRRYVCISL
jgi:hypothetical protein